MIMKAEKKEDKGKRKQKIKSFFDSLWFNAIMLAVGIYVLVENIINKKYIMIAVWIVLVYHFVRQIMKAKK